MENIEKCEECNAPFGEAHKSYCPIKIYGGGEIQGLPSEWSKDPVIARVREDLKQRSEFGLKKYGKPLSDRIDFDLPKWVNHMYEELLDAANYAKCAMLYNMGWFRKQRQSALYAHGNKGFGEEYGTPVQRALRLLEEANEAAQAVGVPYAKAMGVAHYTYNRKPGDPAVEIGQVGVTILMLAESLGIDAEAEELREADKFLARPIEEMKARLKEKLAGGMPVGDLTQGSGQPY